MTPDAILLVDPDEPFRAHLRGLLEARGHTVGSAGSAMEANDFIVGHGTALFVVNERLGETGGISWLGSLRAKGLTSPAVLLLPSDSAVDPGPRVLDLHGILLVLRKPVDDALLVESLAAILTKNRTFPKRTLSTLRLRYAGALPEKLSEFSRALATLKENEGDADALAYAKLLAHRLRGTAGGFGFFEVGERAGEIEDAIGRLLSAAGSYERQSIWTFIDGALAAAIIVAARHDSAPPSNPSLIPEDTVPSPRIEIAPDRNLGVPREFAISGANAPTMSSPPPPSGPMMAKVLIVDDDPSFLEYIEALGRRKLLNVICASNVNEALEKGRTLLPDVALIDVRLGPTELSFGLARDLRALPGCRNMPLAFISAARDIPNRVAAASAGASLYLTKPLDSIAFDAAMQQLFAMGGGDGQRRILLADDEAPFSEALAVLLRERGWVVMTTRSPLNLLDVLDEAKPELLMIDLTLPQVGGLDICRMLRGNLRWQGLPIVILTRRDDVDARIKAFAAGADDYLVKPVHIDELTARIGHRVDRARVARERAGRDPLTGLLLRRAFLELLAIRLSEAERHQRSLSLCLLDLDKFKRINDTHGHVAGDQVLMGLGRLLSTRFRIEDLRGRWGGEEFIVVFPGESAETTFPLFSRILSEFAQIPFTSPNNAIFHATFSAGIASFGPDGSDVESLVSVADKRLYQAKKRGRNQIVIEGE